MAYFVKGIPKLQKPVSTLGKVNQSLQQQQKVRMMEKQQKQQLLLQAANMRLRQEQADKQMQMQAMRLQEQRLKNEASDSRRADTRQSQFQGELRRMKGSAELEPYAQPFFEQLLDQRMIDTDNLRDPDVGKVNMALDDILNFVDTYSVNDDYNKQLRSFSSIANDELEQNKQNKTLKESFQQIDSEETMSRFNQVKFLSDGGLARDMQIQIGPLGSASNIVGIPFQQFDEEGQPIYDGQLTPIQSSPHYHNPESDYMRTAMNPYFGQSFNEVGQGLQGYLQNDMFNGGPWNEAKAREHIGGILRTPFGVKGREWRMRSLAGNVTDPSNPEPTDNGLYFQLQDDPETLKEITKMVVDYDLYENGQAKPLYSEYKTEIDAAIKLAEDKITLASNYETRPVTGGARTPRQRASDTQESNRLSMVSSRVPYVDDESGVIGSFYEPAFLQRAPINISSDNSEAVAAWDTERDAFYESEYIKFLEAFEGAEALAQSSAQASAESEYPERSRPDETITYRFDRFIVMPDGQAEDGTMSLILKNQDGEQFTVSSVDSREWEDISSRLKREGIDMADLMNDMDQGWWSPDDPEVVARTGAPEATPEQTQETVTVSW